MDERLRQQPGMHGVIQALQVALAGVYRRLSLSMVCTYLAVYYAPFVCFVLPLLLGQAHLQRPVDGFSFHAAADRDGAVVLALRLAGAERGGV